MSFLQNTVVLLSLISIIFNFCSDTFATSTETPAILKVNDTVYMMLVIPYDGGENKRVKGTLNRVKRQGKFADSAKMSPMKVLRLYLQMFKNPLSSAPIGGAHPMKPEVITPTIKLFKHRIIGFFFPEVGDEKV